MGVIDVKKLSKCYQGKKGSKIHALRDLDLEIGDGEIFGFLGPNGAGKSTTIKILLGLIRATSGEASIKGIDSVLPAARRLVGYLPENPAFYEYLTAQEYLEFVGGTLGMGLTCLAAKIEEITKLLNLWDARKRPIRSYSKGMVQRLGLAQALIHDPDIFILDEPMSGLDPLGRALVKEIMVDLKKRGKCVFFSTHITADVESVCDRVGVIVKGEMKCVKKVDDITVGGITGYEVRYSPSGTGLPETIHIPKEDLPRKLCELQASNHSILMVEPVRKNLEQFFVDIVSQE